MKQQLRDFVTFIREKGVLGLAVGIIVGGAVTKLVSAIVTDFVNPLIGAVTGSYENLALLAYTVPFTKITFMWGHLLSNIIEFISILLVVYVVFVKTPILSHIDKKPE